MFGITKSIVVSRVRHAGRPVRSPDRTLSGVSNIVDNVYSPPAAVITATLLRGQLGGYTLRQPCSV